MKFPRHKGMLSYRKNKYTNKHEKTIQLTNNERKSIIFTYRIAHILLPHLSFLKIRKWPETLSYTVKCI